MSQFADVLDFIARQGRNGDTELAHVNPREKAMLQAMGGSGTINPKTGLREYFDGSNGGADFGGQYGGYGEGWGSSGPSAPDFGGQYGGYGEGWSATPPEAPANSDSSFGRSVGDFMGLNNPNTAGPALAGLLGGTPFGMMAMAGQALGNWARDRGYSVSTDYSGLQAGSSGADPGSAAPRAPSADAGFSAAQPGLAAMPYYPGDVGLQRRVYAYAEGGQVGPRGVPQRPGLAPPGGQAPNAQAMMAEAQRFAQQHPQQMTQVQAMIQESIQEGEVTPQQVTALVQMATLALQQPEMYPQLRAAAINQGLIEDDDLSPEFDRGMLFLLLIAGKSMSAAGAQAPAQAGQSQVMPSMSVGGALPARSPQADGSIDIKAHEGEYVVPAHVVRAKGTEFFDKLVSNYAEGR